MHGNCMELNMLNDGKNWWTLSPFKNLINDVKPFKDLINDVKPFKDLVDDVEEDVLRKKIQASSVSEKNDCVLEVSLFSIKFCPFLFGNRYCPFSLGSSFAHFHSAFSGLFPAETAFTTFAIGGRCDNVKRGQNWPDDSSISPKLPLKMAA